MPWPAIMVRHVMMPWHAITPLHHIMACNVIMSWQCHVMTLHRVIAGHYMICHHTRHSVVSWRDVELTMYGTIVFPWESAFTLKTAKNGHTKNNMLIFAPFLLHVCSIPGPLGSISIQLGIIPASTCRYTHTKMIRCCLDQSGSLLSPTGSYASH